MTTNPSCWFDPAEIAMLAAASAAATPAGVRGAVPPFATWQAAIETRCAEFLDWVTRRFPEAGSVFLTNADGLPVMGTRATQAEVAAAASLMASVFDVNANLQMRIDRISVGIGDGKLLQLVFLRRSSVDTLAVGVVSAVALDEGEQRDLRAALRELTRTIDAPTTGDEND